MLDASFENQFDHDQESCSGGFPLRPEQFEFGVEAGPIDPQELINRIQGWILNRERKNLDCSVLHDMIEYIKLTEGF